MYNEFVIKDIESGKIKIIENGELNIEAKESLLSLFKNSSQLIQSNSMSWLDKLEWRTGKDAQEYGFRMCPGTWLRQGTFIGKSVVLMPCFINLGASVDEGTLIDSGVTVGSCVQIGKNCHISSNVVLAGVLEPMQAMPVIIEDDCFIGAGSVIAEGMVVSRNCAFAAGCVFTASTRVYDRQTGTYKVGEPIPANSLVVPGTYPTSHGLSINCLIIVKTVGASTKAKLALNDLLRD